MTKIFDGPIEGKEEITKLLKFLCSKDILCTMKFSTGMSYERVKMIEVNDTAFRWKFTKNNSTLDKTSPISDLDCVEVEADGGMINMFDPNHARWSALDIEGDSN